MQINTLLITQMKQHRIQDNNVKNILDSKNKIFTHSPLSDININTPK